MSAIALKTHGDLYERKYYDLFLKNEFPSYEIFWLTFIVPMTNRPHNIFFKSDDELAEMGLGGNEICIAQLHYSIAMHLSRVFDIKGRNRLDIDGLTEGFVRLVGAHDIAFELLERYHEPLKYHPWLPVNRGREKGSQEAQKSWRQKDNKPLEAIRRYRNNLVHGRILPGIVSGDYYVPKLGMAEQYFDWRIITNNESNVRLIGTDFMKSSEILQDAWNQTIDYIESRWRRYLIEI